VFVEAQLATGADHAPQLRERLLLVRDGAEHERGDPGVERGVVDWESLSEPVDDLHREVGLCRSLACSVAQVALGFDCDDLVDGPRVVGKVEPVAGSHFDHAAREAGEQLAAVVGLAALFRFGAETVIHAGKSGW
jgi:hypothetical protein